MNGKVTNVEVSTKDVAIVQATMAAFHIVKSNLI